jgi:1-aminocyclopropane-1-carboxylate deaminase/D-cysteine desulfhydrase-like pyridoxal-dependent ACC family enzyme
VEWPDAVYDKVGNILLSRIMGADVRLDPAGFDIGFRPSWEQALADVEARQAVRRRAHPTTRSAGSASRAGPTSSRSRNASSACSSTRSSSAR